ncbi:MAG: class I SAM-dependent methyltransferase [Candidatus Eremiobacteraeota bacterium]|nr:class I SAM-dependent methyltransferase [Candidatus Eremiobacteraeota bacterium]
MGVGGVARAFLGKHFHTVAKLYRAAFVDLVAVASIVSESIPEGATVLDVGGGDGAPLNYLLALRPDLRIVMIDIAPSVGGALDDRYASRVQRLPETPVETYRGTHPDAALIMDVVHHVPEAQRDHFFGELAALARLHGLRRIIVKEVGTGHIRSVLGLLADRYISGDKNVRLVPVEALAARLRDALGNGWTVAETRLRQIDPPNYCLVASLSS